MDSNIWIINNEERQISTSSFQNLNPINGKLSGANARNYFLKSNLPLETLAIIWGLSDIDKDGALTLVEFTIAYKLVTLSLRSVSLPRTLPSQLIQSATASAVTAAPLNFGSSSSSNLLATSLLQNPAPLTASLSSSLLANLPNQPNQPLLKNSSFQTKNSSISSTQREKYTTLFNNCPDARMSGKVSGVHARPILVQSGLPNEVLARIWQECDLDKDGFLSLDDFIKAMTLIESEKNNLNLAINFNSAKIIPLTLDDSAQQTNKAPVSFFGRKDDASSKLAEEFLEKQRKATQELLEKEREAAELFHKQELEKQRALECSKNFTNDLRKLTLDFETKIEKDLLEMKELKNKESILTEQVAQLKLQIKQIDSLNINIEQQQRAKQNIPNTPISTSQQENQQQNISSRTPSTFTQKQTTSNFDPFSALQSTEESSSSKLPPPFSDFDKLFPQRSTNAAPFISTNQSSNFDPFSLNNPTNANQSNAQVSKSQDLFQPLPNPNVTVQSMGDLSTIYKNSAVQRPIVPPKPASISKDEINIKTVSNFELKFSSTQQTKGVNSRELNKNSSIQESNSNKGFFQSNLPQSPSNQEAKKITLRSSTVDMPSINSLSRNHPAIPTRPNRNKLSSSNYQDDPSSITSQTGSHSLEKVPSIPKKPNNYKSKQVEPAPITEFQGQTTEPQNNTFTYTFNETDAKNPPVKRRAQKNRNATIDSFVFPNDDPFSNASSNQLLQDITQDIQELRFQSDNTKSEVKAESTDDNVITYDPPLLGVSIKPFQSKETSFRFHAGDALNITFKSGDFYYAEVDGIGDWFPVSSVKLNTPSKISYDMSKFRLALYDNDIEEPNDIEFREGDLITISKEQGDWGSGYSNGKIGVFPMNFVTYAEKFNTLESRTVRRNFEAGCNFEISLSTNTNVTILHKNQSGWCYGHAQNSSTIGCFHISCIDTSVSEPTRSYPKGDN